MDDNTSAGIPVFALNEEINKDALVSNRINYVMLMEIRSAEGPVPPSEYRKAANKLEHRAATGVQLQSGGKKIGIHLALFGGSHNMMASRSGYSARVKDMVVTKIVQELNHEMEIDTMQIDHLFFEPTLPTTTVKSLRVVQ